MRRLPPLLMVMNDAPCINSPTSLLCVCTLRNFNFQLKCLLELRRKIQEKQWQKNCLSLDGWMEANCKWDKNCNAYWVIPQPLALQVLFQRINTNIPQNKIFPSKPECMAIALLTNHLPAGVPTSCCVGRRLGSDLL